MNLQLNKIFDPKIEIIGQENESCGFTGKKDVFSLKKDCKIDRLANSFHIREDLLDRLNNNESVIFYDDIPVDNIGSLSMILQSLKQKGIDCVASKNVKRTVVFWQYGYCKNNDVHKDIVDGWLIRKIK